ncbi:unnamed protein product [Blepharisma stoltei]|uniref:UBC core domain-containing protein n=1 Tax=Blepharisma stoltei TaxID=1481888 RepID=A0AAU9ITL4_9CILI|nr:unnamed protein product [Blepharisma stoltei]CAG9324179.1 unnamed protein product [Blepharisma stoltei]
MAALQRLMTELNDLQANPQPFVSVNTHQGDYYEWLGNLNGPEGTAFEGGLFEFLIKFSKKYPSKPPKVYFQTPIFHPNIFPSNGRVCHSLLNHMWNPNCHPRVIIDYLIELLNRPEPEHGFMCEAADICLISREEWFNIARERTFRDAFG